jgi:hypothetical protein
LTETFALNWHGSFFALFAALRDPAALALAKPRLTPITAKTRGFDTLRILAVNRSPAT